MKVSPRGKAAASRFIMAAGGYPALADLTPDALRRVTAWP
jgi:hypothetical protein